MYLTRTSEAFGVDDQSWLGSSHGTQATQTITLDTSAFTKATHYPEGFFKSGIPLQELPSGLYGPYTGTGALAGHLYAAVGAPPSDEINVGAAILEHGRVRVSRLPVSLDVTAARAAVGGRIIYAD